jgi:hypothetical protein
MKTPPSLALTPSGLFAVLIVVVSSLFSAGCHTGTLRAQNIELVDDKGRARLYMHGGHDSVGPLIVFFDENADDDNVDDEGMLLIALGKTGPKGAEKTSVLIHAESGRFGNLGISAQSDGAQLFMGSDETDQFEIKCDKEGLTVSLEPKEDTSKPVPGRSGAEQSPVPSPARGVRITLDHGRIVVHDLAGHEIGALPDPAPSVPIAPH